MITPDMRLWITRDPEWAASNGCALAWCLLDDGSWLFLRGGRFTRISVKAVESLPNGYFIRTLESNWDEVSSPCLAKPTPER